ncbi:hypothetical protein MUB24_11255 [Lederbergia sp. NSJ-179]|uniref:hypothetical protein n=1 Tax=Lederbergia sp. NSJ-179 TaxID=2931402 RepID=UPI001FD36AD7|nr:hypothetical protein [Lederbergia sp. NSJ-179]MCJ7841461.1 hypothetical protein [Lederbergia sp. NSJ-179]
MVQNDCLIVTGTSLINAFDRLEVAEYSAKAFISTIGFGNIYKIGDKEINELENAFNI